MAPIGKMTFIFLSVLLNLNVFGQTENVSFSEIYNLIEQKNFFKAKEAYDLKKNDLPLEYQKITEAFLDNAFNRLEESQLKISDIINRQVPDSLKFKLYQIKEDNAIKASNYKEAKSAISTILSDYKEFLSKEEIEDSENSLKIWSALEGIPRQKITISRNTVFKMEKDVAGLNNLKVSVNRDTLNFIFDTGANLSTTSQSIAKRLKMIIIPVDINVGTITGSIVSAQLAVCDKINLGNIEIQNVVFLVCPDEALSFPQINYQIYGILGFPIIEALKEMQITQDGQFIIPKEETNFAGNSNMAMNGLTPLIYIDGKHYSFDTGADNTILYRSFYLANQDEIDKNYQTAKINFGGAGGKAEFNGFVINQTFNVSGKNITLKDIQLLKEKIDDDETVYGNIGQDLIRQFNKMTINFNQMFIKFD